VVLINEGSAEGSNHVCGEVFANHAAHVVCLYCGSESGAMVRAHLTILRAESAAIRARV
jgi:hypothetical protein